MKKLFSFVIEPLERGDDDYAYKPLQRKVLLFLSLLFLSLAVAVVFVAKGQLSAAMLPAVIFGSTAIYGLIVGIFGSDKAVARLWKSART